jgi:hypothetical protein
MSSFMESQTERCPRKEYFGALRASPAGSLLKPLFHFSCLSKSSHQSPIPRSLEARFACLPNIGSQHLLPFLSSPMFFLSPLSHIDRYRSFSTRCHRQPKPPESSQHCSSQEEVQHTQIYSDKGQSGHFRAGHRRGKFTSLLHLNLVILLCALTVRRPSRPNWSYNIPHHATMIDLPSLNTFRAALGRDCRRDAKCLGLYWAAASPTSISFAQNGPIHCAGR